MIFESGRADKPAFAAKIEEKLTERGMSPEELAAKVYVRPKTIRHIMKGIYSPSLRLERDIAKVLGCTADELFVFDDV
ncbi:MAG: helix-turn-helix domain-containing protein [Oscillospiraceae bacterium]|nr:helix-turn-helix domain-containing protein [Oscillospiraceae bacterium]